MDSPYLKQTGFALDIKFIRSRYTEQDGTATCGAMSLDLGNVLEQGCSWKLIGGQLLIGVHAKNECKGKRCPIHKPTKHHMSSWQQNWHPSKRIIERICPHGISHPDPDESTPDNAHECDGCCTVVN